MIEFCNRYISFQITSNVLSKLVSYKQVFGKNEAGGMLIGSIVNLDNTIEINDFTEPIEDDKRNFVGYKRSDKHNKILDQKWKESNYKKLYIGEWHTHPQNEPIPSIQDKISWDMLLSKSVTESEYLIFIIVGIKSLEIWIGDKKERKVDKGATYMY